LLILIGFSKHIFDNAKDPVLYIDHQKVHHTEIRAAVKQLNVRHIAYLFIQKEPQLAIHYEQNAKNSMVKVWTKVQLEKIKEKTRA
jgi:hypothetical protein